MRPALSTLNTPIDVGVGGVLLANMLAAWLDGNPEILPAGETTDEHQDPGTSPEQTGLHLLTPVDAQPKSATIRRARSVSTHCDRRRWNWAGANPRSARWIGTWGRRVPK